MEQKQWKFTINIEKDTQISEINFTPQEDNSGVIYYLIQKGSELIQFDNVANYEITERNYIESHIDVKEGKTNLLNARQGKNVER